ncbi:hypothetical protein C1H46_029658 [Malus baccata]|uniref:Enolpyruvate transferase domain-containing protein n=1 Tax=Malus baccata TaxID=106549 RepID=A0A540LEE4_MALBA|nr:hypothetical protein C1H46_029658 [Malus baccata]
MWKKIRLTNERSWRVVVVGFPQGMNQEIEFKCSTFSWNCWNSNAIIDCCTWKHELEKKKSRHHPPSMLEKKAAYIQTPPIWIFLHVLDRVPGMRERPIGDMVAGLKQLGADADCFLGTNCPPVRVIGKGGLPGGRVKLSGSVSSVYWTSLLMASPLALGDIEIDIVNGLVSSPFVEMTLKVMEHFGVTLQHNDILD